LTRVAQADLAVRTPDQIIKIGISKGNDGKGGRCCSNTITQEALVLEVPHAGILL